MPSLQQLERARPEQEVILALRQRFTPHQSSVALWRWDAVCRSYRAALLAAKAIHNDLLVQQLATVSLG